MRCAALHLNHGIDGVDGAALSMPDKIVKASPRFALRSCFLCLDPLYSHRAGAGEGSNAGGG